MLKTAKEKERLAPAPNMVELLDLVATSGLDSWSFFERSTGQSTSLSAASTLPAAIVHRGVAHLPASGQVIVALLVIEDPLTGAGSHRHAVVRLGDDQVEPGIPEIPMTIAPLPGDNFDGLGWEGSISGRLVTSDAAYDFGADGESRLTHRDGSLVAVLRLGTDWVERDASGRELLARLRGIVLFRETS